jgi:inner membrane protein
MDVVTQAIFGAAAGHALAGRKLPRSAWLIGAVAGYLPDADIFITFPNDTLSTWLIHRHFTHGVGFWPMGAMMVMILAVVCVFIATKARSSAKPPALRWNDARGFWLPGLIAAMGGIMTHGVLDSCTSFGTMMWWPVSYQRVSWDLVAIIDPLVSFPMLAMIIWSVVCGWNLAKRQANAPAGWYRGVRRWSVVSLVWAAIYIGGLGYIQRERALAIQQRIAASRGDVVERGRVLMAPLQNYVFRSIYLSDGKVKSDMIRVPWWPFGSASFIAADHSEARLIQVSDVEKLDLSPAVVRDASRFITFTQDWAVWHPEIPKALADARYGLGTQSMASLWYLDLQPARSNPATTEITRLVQEMSRVNRQRDELIGILLGRDARLETIP